MKMLEDLAEVVRLITEYENHTRDDNGCSDHPMAPHGFNRNESHNQDRYVCDCETWQPDAASELAIARALVLYVLTHHATIRDMAKQLLEIQAENSMLRAGLEAAERDAVVWRCTRSYPTGDGGRYYSEEFAKTKADMLIYKAKGYHCEVLNDDATQETGR